MEVMVIKNRPHRRLPKNETSDYCGRDATRCGMLDIDGTSDAHYNAHIHINKGPGCERSQY